MYLRIALIFLNILVAAVNVHSKLLTVRQAVLRQSTLDGVGRLDGSRMGAATPHIRGTHTISRINHEFVVHSTSRGQRGPGVGDQRMGGLRVGDGRLGMWAGKNATITKYPFQVAVRVDNVFACAGAIVSKSWVVVTGACVYYVDPASIQVLVGSQDTVHGTSYDVVRTIVHPKYDDIYNNYNYACVEVKGTFSGSITPLLLPSSQPADNTVMAVAGWGATMPWLSPPGHFKEGEMTWLPHSTCQNWYNSTDVILDKSMGCAYDNHKVSLCDGDWGDPFVVKGVLYGMMIDGINWCFCTYDAPPVLVANIATVSSWIQSNTGAKMAQ